MRSKAILILSCVLFAVGLVILLFDVDTHHRYGVHLNEMAGIVDGVPINWPTGEEPLTAMVSPWICTLVFWLAAAAVQACRLARRCGYDGRIYRGTE